MENVRLQFLSLRQGTASRICRASHSAGGWRLSRPAWCGQLDFGFRRRSEIDVTNSERVGSQFLSLRQQRSLPYSPGPKSAEKNRWYTGILAETSAPRAPVSGQISFSRPHFLQTLGLRPKSAEVFGLPTSAPSVFEMLGKAVLMTNKKAHPPWWLCRLKTWII